MRIVPDGSNALKPPAPPPPPSEPRAEAPALPKPLQGGPASVLEPGDPTAPMLTAPVSQPILPSAARRRVLWAVIFGVVIGILAVLALQLFGGPRSS